MARAGLAAGPLLALAVVLTPEAWIEGLSADGQTTAAVAIWMAVWWMTEAIPLPATSLLPLLLFPLAGILSVEEAARPYANQYIFLFMGGFMLARAVERWQLHRRIALLTVLGAGTAPTRLVGGFMAATAVLSMWISNTAATVMMLPIGMSLVSLLDEQLTRAGKEHAALRSNFATALMLGIAYASSLGGMATLVGTPTNLFLAGFAAEHDLQIGFGRWLLFAFPLSVLLLVCTWLLLAYVVFPLAGARLPEGRQLIREQLRLMGRMSRGEKLVLFVFVTTASCWVLREPLTSWSWLTERAPWTARVDDTLIAIAAALVLFVLPVDWRRGRFALDWETAVTIPWGVLLLFGGGFSLAAAITSSGLAQWIGGHVASLAGWHLLLLLGAVVVLVVFLTELTSNTPTAAAFLPILHGVAVTMEMDSLLLLIPATLAATCAFMLPVATPPNAIVFGSGRVPMAAMVRAGWWLNLLCIAAIPLWTLWVGRWVFQIAE